jgi:hypothetical protein
MFGRQCKAAAALRALARPSHQRRTVTVRITIKSDGAPRRIVVEGRLTGAEVGELELAIGDDPSAVCLDLENLRSADADGLAALRRFRAEGALIRGVPPHLAWRLEDGG